LDQHLTRVSHLGELLTFTVDSVKNYGSPKLREGARFIRDVSGVPTPFVILPSGIKFAQGQKRHRPIPLRIGVAGVDLQSRLIALDRILVAASFSKLVPRLTKGSTKSGFNASALSTHAMASS
jgi:hypothetical protein